MLQNDLGQVEPQRRPRHEIMLRVTPTGSKIDYILKETDREAMTEVDGETRNKEAGSARSCLAMLSIKPSPPVSGEKAQANMTRLRLQRAAC